MPLWWMTLPLAYGCSPRKCQLEAVALEWWGPKGAANRGRAKDYPVDDVIPNFQPQRTRFRGGSGWPERARFRNERFWRFIQEGVSLYKSCSESRETLGSGVFGGAGDSGRLRFWNIPTRRVTFLRISCYEGLKESMQGG